MRAEVVQHRAERRPRSVDAAQHQHEQRADAFLAAERPGAAVGLLSLSVQHHGHQIVGRVVAHRLTVSQLTGEELLNLAGGHPCDVEVDLALLEHPVHPAPEGRAHLGRDAEQVAHDFHGQQLCVVEGAVHELAVADVIQKALGHGDDGGFQLIGGLRAERRQQRPAHRAVLGRVQGDRGQVELDVVRVIGVDRGDAVREGVGGTGGFDDVVVAGHEIRAVEALGLSDGAALAQVGQDLGAVRGPLLAEMVEVGRPVGDRRSF